MRILGKSIGSLLCAAVCIFVASKATAQNLVLNPGFELAGATPNIATNWNILAATGGTMALITRTNATPNSGSFDLYLESAGGAGAPNTDVRSDPMAVSFGTSYNFSFEAKNPLKSGGANPQWDIFWLNALNNPVGGPVFQSFSSVGSSYTLVTNAVTLTPPVGATKVTVGWIQAVGAGATDHWVTQIDDVSFTAVPEPTTVTLVGFGLLGAVALGRKRKS
jgi:PEP-CTERM motif